MIKSEIFLLDINSIATEMNTALKSLQLHWQITTNLWNDSVSQSFESKFLSPTERDTQIAIKEMKQLAMLIADARRQIK